MNTTVKNHTHQAWSGLLKWAGYLVYLLAVAFADVIFLAMLSSMFPTGFLGTLAFVGALATGFSMALLPLAKAYWVRPGAQLVAALVFWAVELVVMALNLLLAWQESQGAVDAWFLMWKMYGTAATPLVAVIGWFALWATDPHQRLRDAQHELETEIIEQLRSQYQKALQDERVYESLVEGALHQARLMAEQLAQVHLSPLLEPNHREESHRPESDAKESVSPHPSR